MQPRGWEGTAWSREPLKASKAPPAVLSLKQSYSMARFPTTRPDHRLATGKAEAWPSMETPIPKQQGHATTQKRKG